MFKTTLKERSTLKMLITCKPRVALTLVFNIFCVFEQINSNSCIKNIANTYFVYPPVVTVFVTNSTVVDVKDIGIYDINSSIKLRSFLSFQIDFGEHHKSYAIILSENLEELLNEKVLPKLAVWNARAKYIFHATKNVSSDDLQKFTTMLWDNYIVDAIILTYGEDENVKVYSYFPYINGQCGDQVKYQLIDTCKNGEFNANTTLFPNKVPPDLNNCIIRVHVIIWAPFILMPVEGIQNYSNIDFKEGVDIELMKTLSKHINFKIVFSSSKVPHDWGLVTPNGIPSGAMKVLKEKRAELAVGAIGPTAERHMYLDFAYGHILEGLACCVPKAQLSPAWRSLVDTFHPNTWISMIITYIFVSVMIWLICSLPPRDTTSYVVLHKTFNFVYSISLNVSPKESPKKRSGRIIYFCWIIFALHFTIAYQAKLISFLTNPAYEPQMNSVEEMLNSNMEFVLLPTVRRFFANTDDWKVKKILSKWKDCFDSDKCLSRIAYERNLAFFTTKVHMEFETLRYVDSSGNPLIYCFSYLIYPSEIYMTKGHPLKDRIDTVVMRIKGAGLILKWKADIERIWKHKYTKEMAGSGANNMPLTLSHLEGAFFISGFGLCFSVIIFFIEIFIHRFFKKKEKLKL